MANYKNEHYVCACHQYEECTYDCHKFRLMERKPSNADRIRSMSDEELAGYLSHLELSWRPAYARKGKKEWLDWLKECE